MALDNTVSQLPPLVSSRSSLASSEADSEATYTDMPELLPASGAPSAGSGTPMPPSSQRHIPYMTADCQFGTHRSVFVTELAAAFAPTAVSDATSEAADPGDSAAAAAEPNDGEVHASLARHVGSR